MKVRKQGNVERIGVLAVGHAFERLGQIFREQTVSDFGVDAHVEIMAGEEPTGRILALQIKSGKSYFAETVSSGVVFRFDDNDYQYWQHYVLPVLVVLHDPRSEDSYWQVVSTQTAIRARTGWKMVVPFSQRIDETSLGVFKQVAALAKQLDLESSMPNETGIFTIEVRGTKLEADMARVEALIDQLKALAADELITLKRAK
jgi:hypothetical protein